MSATSIARGFSLIELLVLVAVTGVLTAIAIPKIDAITSSAKTATAQRNAQSIVAVYEYGKAAGIDWSGCNRKTTIKAVLTGSYPLDGVFVGSRFRLPQLGPKDLIETYPFVGYDSKGDLFYDETGSQSPE